MYTLLYIFPYIIFILLDNYINYKYSFSFLLTKSGFFKNEFSFLCASDIFTEWVFFLINEQKFYSHSVTISFSSEQNFTSPLFRSGIPVLWSRKSTRCRLKPRRYQLLISPAPSSLAMLFYPRKICI